MWHFISYAWNRVHIINNRKQLHFGSETERADLVLYPNGFQLWDWNNPETFCDKHSPGISKQAIDFLIKKQCKKIILTKGFGSVDFKKAGMLETQPDVIKYATSKGLTVYHLKTEDAIQLWEQIYEDNDVGMYLHTTC